MPAMKITALFLLLSASALSASDSALPSFSEKLYDRPELSLSEAVKNGQLPLLDPVKKPRVEMILRRASTAQKRVVSRMPVIEPTSDIDRNMPIVAPRTDIEAKMLVKEPCVVSMR